MSPKLQAIYSEIEDMRSFADESYLATSYFVIFLLFGFSAEQRRTFETEAKKIIAKARAFALIDAEPEGGVIAAVEAAYDSVSEGHIDVETLNEVHVCPVIISEKSDASAFCAIVGGVDTYLRKRDIIPEWKSFLLLETKTEAAADWLDAMTDATIQLSDNAGGSCRCCILTRQDENGFSVAEERLLSTVLFVAFLHVVRDTRESVGRHIGYDKSRPELLFYTAQTAFVENPIVTRIFTRMKTLLETLIDRPRAAERIDMKFIQDILKDSYSKMPREGGFVSLLPLYSVMSGEINDFSRRLKDFAEAHYLSFIQTDEARSEIYSRIASEFLQKYIRAGLGVDELKTLVGNEEEIAGLSKVQAAGISIAELPAYPAKNNQSPELIEKYERCAAWLKNEILTAGKRLLEDFFRSDYFMKLPKKYRSAQEQLKNAAEGMGEVIRQRKKLDITLRLENDPDEKWTNEIIKDDELTEVFIKHIGNLAMAENDLDIDAELSALVDLLYQKSKGLSGSGGAATYMELVSYTCVDPTGSASLGCAETIGKALVFPIKINNYDVLGSRAYIWGSRENRLFDVLEKNSQKIHSGGSVSLPLKSNERFAVLRVSSAFARKDISRVGGKEG
ncbi:MAG: hypothetical protein LBM98_01060 [Oscillospiraceae bacterium]|jgi:hypothetical protein|nr:hypothetical protein [Oscillospiraceae bacterium]